MSKKKNNLVLIIVFIVLLVAVGVNQLIRATRGERTFRKDIIEMEANEISGFNIYPKTAGNVKVEVYRDDTLWRLKFNGQLFAADQDMINGITDELATMVPERLVATSKDQWPEYDITDSLGVRVEVLGKKGDKTEIILGRFTFNQATRQPSTYVRVNREKEVYAVIGYLSMTFNRELSSLRDKNIFRGNPTDLTKIEFRYPADSSFTLTREGTSWTMNGVPVDSARMANYLQNISYVAGVEFRDDFIPAAGVADDFRITLSGNNMKQAEIRAFIDSRGIVLNSSENPQAYFKGEQPDIFRRLFLSSRNFTTPLPSK